MIWAVLTGQLTGSSFGLRLALYFPSASISSVFVAMYLYLKFFLLNSFLYLLVSWAWWDWPLTWLTNHWPSVVWHCWLGHLTHKIVPKMAYNVSSEMLNPTVPYLYCRLLDIPETVSQHFSPDFFSFDHRPPWCPCGIHRNVCLASRSSLLLVIFPN